VKLPSLAGQLPQLTVYYLKKRRSLWELACQR